MLSKLILSLSLLILPTFLLAKKPPAEELEARAGDSIIRLAGSKCTYKTVLEQINSEYHAQFKKAELKVSGKPIKGCWTIDANGVFVIFEDGSQGYVPTEMFKPVEVI